MYCAVRLSTFSSSPCGNTGIQHPAAQIELLHAGIEISSVITQIEFPSAAIKFPITQFEVLSAAIEIPISFPMTSWSFPLPNVELSNAQTELWPAHMVSDLNLVEENKTMVFE